MSTPEFRFWDGEKMLYYGLFNIPQDISYEGLPMQDTGLLDKNGEKIFAGDIMREPLEWTGKNNPILHKVVWSVMGPTLKNWEGEYITSDDFEQCEIIGNIYQHKNLIK